jgi:hypothetical protein
MTEFRHLVTELVIVAGWQREVLRIVHDLMLLIFPILLDPIQLLHCPIHILLEIGLYGILQHLDPKPLTANHHSNNIPFASHLHPKYLLQPLINLDNLFNPNNGITLLIHLPVNPHQHGLQSHPNTLLHPLIMLQHLQC